MPTLQPGVTHPRFGDLLRRLRVARGLTQEGLAERTGLSVRGISDLERGVRTSPRPETILLLSEGLALAGDEQGLLWATVKRTPRPRLLSTDTTWLPPAEGLPAPGAFVGRAPELATILLALHDPSSRLLTLTGPPGVGKTRLAIEATRQLDALVPIDVAFVDLAPIRDPSLVRPAITSAIGLAETGSETLDRLQARLAARPTLLFLDNFEHLLPAAPLVADLLQMGDTVRLLVTSREPLRIDYECELTIPPLATPRLTREMGIRDVVTHEAVALFVVRARESDRHFRLTNENACAIAELCIRLDGLPLALELAAARVRRLTPAAMVDRLAGRRPVLTAGRHDLPERQRTLADAIDWSYDLLPPDEQRLFRLCSVFLGGFTPESAESIANAGDDHDVRGRLASLADKNLLVRQHPTGWTGDARFSMLETIREYGLERLEADSGLASVRAIHAAHFLTYAEAASRDFCLGAGQRATIERLAAEYDNVRQALAWFREQPDPHPFLRLSGSLWRFWSIHGHATEGQGWLESASKRGADAPPAERARVLIAASRLAWVRGQFALATEQLEQAIALDPGPFDRCEALNALGDVAREEGDFTRAEAALSEAIALGRAREDWFHLGASLHNLGIVELERGACDRARIALAEGLAMARGMNNDYLAYSALHYLSRLALEQGDLARAVALRRDDLAMQRALAPLNAHGAARFFEGIAQLAMVHDLPEPAARFFGAAETQRAEAEDIERAERRQIAPGIAAARTALGEARFTQAWAAGQALSVAEALAEATTLLEAWR